MNKTLVAGLLLAAVAAAGCTAGLKAVRETVAGLPAVRDLQWVLPTVIFDRHGHEVFRWAAENRQPVKIGQVPAHVRQAFVAIEDPRFYAHAGVDLRGIARAAWHNLLVRLGRAHGVQGGSTITQQLARSGWLNQELSLGRKVREALLALQLERKYTKDEILEMYLNQIYFGHGAYGIQAAARTYFGRDAAGLDLAQGALLAAVINGPSIYDPFLDPEAARARRDQVLQAMAGRGLATPEQVEQATRAPLPRAPASGAVPGNWYVDTVLSILTRPGLASQYGVAPMAADELRRSGLQIHTALDPDLQAAAEAAVQGRMAAADKEYGLAGDPVKPQAAAVMLDPRSGHVLALVGGRGRAGLLEYNRAMDALRQPGSAIKPLVAYLPALEAGALAPATILDDAPAALTRDGKSVWPENYDHKYHGLVPARYAVEQSLNAPAVRALRLAGGPAKGWEYGKRFGLDALVEEDKREVLALGGITRGATLLQMTVAYGAIANLGARRDPVFITRITDRNGKVLFQAKPRRTEVVSADAAWLMIDMLKDVVRRGTAYGFTGGFRGWPAAGKTGTTDQNVDGWFIGFTPALVAGVWTGYDNGDQVHSLKWTGAFVPVQIWNEIMRAAVPAAPADWPRPDGLVAAPVCRRTGQAPGALCPPDQVARDWFPRGQVPTQPGDLLVAAAAVKEGEAYRLWQAGCAGVPAQRAFIRRPEPYVKHPTDPHNPRYLPADAGQEVPTQKCTPAKTPLQDIWDWLRGDPAPAPEPPARGNKKGRGR